MKALIATDLPEPVDPATKTCGILVRSAITGWPDTPWPKGNCNRDERSLASGDSKMPRRLTMADFWFGISIPTKLLPGIGASTRTAPLLAATANAKSLAKVVILEILVPLANSIAYSDIMNNLHVSGHAASEELKTTIALTKPRFLMPISGMSRQLKAYSQMAQQMGYPADHIMLAEAGHEVLFDNQGNTTLGEVHPYTSVLVDGLGVGDVGEVVIADRQQLADSGVFIVAASLNKNKELVGEIEVQTRGFIYARINEKLMDEARAIARTVLTDQQTKNQDWATIRSRVQDHLAKFFKRETDRTPIIHRGLVDQCPDFGGPTLSLPSGIQPDPLSAQHSERYIRPMLAAAPQPAPDARRATLRVGQSLTCALSGEAARCKAMAPVLANYSRQPLADYSQHPSILLAQNDFALGA